MAIKGELFGQGFFSMFNFKKLNFVFSLFKLVFQYAAFFFRRRRTAHGGDTSLPADYVLVMGARGDPAHGSAVALCGHV